MKIKLSAILVIMMMATMSSVAQEKDTPNDSIARMVKLKELEIKRTNLIKEIKIEDSKRDKSISGVTFETQERLNDKQDSICLDLRSRLVSIELEIKELDPLSEIENAISRHFELKNNSSKVGRKENE